VRTRILRWLGIVTLVLMGWMLSGDGTVSAEAAGSTSSSLENTGTPKSRSSHSINRDATGPASSRMTGKMGQRSGKGEDEDGESSAYAKWKMHLRFWPRKAVLLAELALLVALGVFVGQALEIAGFVRAISFVTKPLTALGGLPREAGPAFLMAFQSGAVANSMLVSERDAGKMNARQLYSSVLVVSALSLFAHLPTFVFPVGLAFGKDATIALFLVRVGAIVLEIVCVLLGSRLISGRWTGGCPRLPEMLTSEEANLAEVSISDNREMGQSVSFFRKVWKRSRKTFFRLLCYMVPTFVVMGLFEYYGFFTYLSKAVPQLFSLPFLPPESVAIIPAQAMSLYNGVLVAGNFVNTGAITSHQAVVIILFGSIVTAPVRTLKHALPTYLGILGARPGLLMAILAQVLRNLFLLFCTVLLMGYWR